MKLPIYQVDAFAGEVFQGNPAAICPIESWLPDELLQKIADENNLSETAYLVPRDGDYEIRWFTPTVEVELCGHATLASAHVLFTQLEPGRRSVRFHSRRSGILSVEARADRLELDFPLQGSRELPGAPEIEQALGVEVEAQFLASNDTFLVLLKDEAAVRSCTPDFSALERLGKCVAITAQGQDADFVCRYFAPTHGINEDPVTGSSYCFLAPFWSKRLGKAEFRAHQVSKRGGEVFCRIDGDRVKIAGKAVLYLQGTISIDG